MKISRLKKENALSEIVVTDNLYKEMSKYRKWFRFSDILTQSIIRLSANLRDFEEWGDKLSIEILRDCVGNLKMGDTESVRLRLPFDYERHKEDLERIKKTLGISDNWTAIFFAVTVFEDMIDNEGWM